MIRFVNLTPHKVQVYSESQFVGLGQTNPTTWVADAVQGNPVAEFESEGAARIATSVVQLPSVDGIPMVATEYGEASGIPESLSLEKQEVVLIVSLAMQSMAKMANHPLASRMVVPYKVVRSRENGSLILGCMGFSY